jgi:hypothetical protein
MKKLGMVAGGFLAGVVIAGLSVNFPLKTLSLAGLLVLPSSFVTYLIIDTKKQSVINQLESQLKDKKLNHESVSKRNDELTVQLSELQTSLKKCKEILITCESERCETASQIDFWTKTVVRLEGELRTSNIRVAELEGEVETMEANFEACVGEEVDKRFQEAKRNEIERIFQEHDFITSEAMRLFRQLQGWGHKVAASHQQKRELITSLAQSYNQNIDNLNTSVDKEREQYLLQIEILRERVAQLQHELAGDLVEPSYLECGFDESGRIANALANWLWVNRKIPLKVTGFEQHADGTLVAGFTYSRSMPVQAILKTIEGDSPTIARNLGLYAIEKAIKLQVTDCLVIKVRRDRPARKTDKGSLYRSKEEFVKFILGQPIRLRVIGEPGAGKTPSVAVLLSHILKRGFLSANTPNGQKLPYCVVESCNPLAGISVKNGDELDFSLKWNDGKAGFKGLVQEYRFRKNPANAEYKNQVGYLWVADEVDNTMAELTKDEAKPFKDALKDGGHVNIGVIVMGQSANVSTSKGLSIDDQKMMTNIYIDPVSIRTFLTQYGERFYSKRAVEKALATLEELEIEIEEQNEIICDTAREFRIGMVTANRSPVFYQLPYFDSVEIDVEVYQETLAKVSELRLGRGETLPSQGVTDDSQDAFTVSDSANTDKSGRHPYVGLGTCPDTSLNLLVLTVVQTIFVVKGINGCVKILSI